MPIYEYRCSKCGDFEVMQKITDKALNKCPKCKAKVHKLISNTSFQLKGSGWYITDYARSGKGKDKESPKSDSSSPSESSSTESSSSTKSESKSESKTESKSDSKSGAKSKGSDSKRTPAAAA